MAIRVCKHCRNRAAKLKWQDLMRAGKWCGSHSWLVLPPESEPFANQGSKCDDFWGSNCESTKFWKIFEVLTRCPSVYMLLGVTVTFTSFFYPMRAQCLVTSQEVTYIFRGTEASTEMAPSKSKLHLGRFYLTNVILHFHVPPNFRGTYPKCYLHFWRCWLYGLWVFHKM